MRIAQIRAWVNAHDATVSVGPAQLRGDTVDAVTCIPLDYERVLVIRCWDSPCSVPAVYLQAWDWTRGVWSTRHIGDLEDAAGLTSDELAISLVFCPRCGGTGEIVVSFTNEAGHRERDVLPCPECSALVDLIECGVHGGEQYGMESD